MSLSGKEIYDNFARAPGAQELESARTALEALAKQDAEIGDEINSAASALESAWEGEAAGAAQRGAGPLATDHALSSEQATVAQDLLRRQVESFDYAKSNVVPVPDVPDTPPSLGEVVTDPDAATYYQRKQEALAAEDQNVRVMNLWDNHSTYNEQMMPTRYGNDVDSTFKTADVGSGSGASVGAGPASGPQIGAGSGAGSGSTGAAGAVVGGVGSAGGTSSGARGGTASRSGSTAGRTSEVTRSAAAETPTTGRLPGSTPRPGTDTPLGRPGTTSGLPGGGVTGIGPGGGAGGVPRGGVPAGGTRGGVPGSGGGLRGGAPGAGGGPRGGVPGTGGQPGRLTGGAPGAGGPGGAGTQAARGGAPGGRGMPGAMGGSGAGRGKGDDDAEHRNKYALPEQLEDGLSREADEYGERTIDERSGQTVVPPVIGEPDAPQPQPAAERESTARPQTAPGQAGAARAAGSTNPYLPPSAGRRPRQP